MADSHRPGGESLPYQLEEAAVHPGEPDGFGRLWTPHRVAYISGENRPKTQEAGAQCPFCRAPEGADDVGLIVRRSEHAYALLNLYPYNSGHLLICPYRHRADLTELESAERAEVIELTAQAMTVLRRVMAPAGFNLGMNQGAVSGAGVAGHLHQHIVPRWAGDTNFFPIIARTRALPEILADTRERVARAWEDCYGQGEGSDAQ